MHRTQLLLGIGMTHWQYLLDVQEGLPLLSNAQDE